MSVWQERLSPNVWLVGVGGRLDQNLSPQLEEKLLDLLTKGENQLVVDLTQVSYINSGGLRCLVSAWRRAQRQEGNVVLCGLNARLQEIFSMIGFDDVFQIFPVSTDAVASFEIGDATG
jgi:anti-sigma B factor antagonist